MPQILAHSRNQKKQLWMNGFKIRIRSVNLLDDEYCNRLFDLLLVAESSSSSFGDSSKS